MPSLAAEQSRKDGLASIFAGSWLQLALFVLVALVMQASTFGDPNRHADEIFYFLVGERMHGGLWPYVDIWDRKPPGLFLIYYLIAGLSASVLSYQIAACLFVAATALAISRIAAGWSDWRGGLFAGLVYLFAIGPFEGGTGQTPDFYNLLLAGAVLLVVRATAELRRRVVSWRVWAAMVLCGLAITVKQTTLFESIFLGLWVVAVLHRAGAPVSRTLGIAALSCAIGAAPMLAFAAIYALAGHGYEFWHAMITSNLAKGATPTAEVVWKALVLLVRGAVVLPLAIGALLAWTGERETRTFLAWWLFAAFAGFLSVPNFTIHYFLPVLVPLSVAAGVLLARLRLSAVIVLALGCYALLWNPIDRRAQTLESIRTMDALAALVRRHDGGGGLLVFDGPIYLYALADKPFLTPLPFPHHLNHGTEHDVSHIDTDAEIDRIVAARPGVIVLSRFARNGPVNRYSRGRILAYVHAHCPFVATVDLVEGRYRIPTMVFGDCGTDPERKHAAIAAPPGDREAHGGPGKD